MTVSVTVDSDRNLDSVVGELSEFSDVDVERAAAFVGDHAMRAGD